MKNKKESRDSSIELLRLVLMLMICIHHCIVHGLGLQSLTGGTPDHVLLAEGQIIYADVLNSFCICAVNCFILISGYYSIRTSARKIIFILLTILFYSIPFNIIPAFMHASDTGNWNEALLSLLFISRPPTYWFVADYLFLMILAPMLNLMFEKFSISNVKLTLLGLLIISCYFGFIWGHSANHTGYTLMQFILMYCIGRYINITNWKLTKGKALLTYFISSLLIATAMWTCQSAGKFGLSWRLTYYNDPLLILSAIALFIFFKNINFQSLFINNIAKSAFAVYLLESSTLISDIVYMIVGQIVTQYNGMIFFIIPILSLITLICAVIIDRLRQIVVNKLISIFNQRLIINEPG